jgi:predicted dehydrogenase
VLSEKPMAYTTAQADALVKAAQARGLLYAIGYMKRYDAGVARAMSVMNKLRADTSLGRVRHARAWCFAGETGGARDNFVMTKEARPDGLELWQDGPDWMPAAMRPGYDAFLNVFSHIINLARYTLGASPVLVESDVAMDGTGAFSLDFGGVPCAFELDNESTGPWREGIEVGFERGVMRIELPPPFAEEEARVFVETNGRRSELPRHGSWAFRRQAQAFVADITGRNHPLASGEDSLTDIALAEAIWKAHLDPSTR